MAYSELSEYRVKLIDVLFDRLELAVAIIHRPREL